MRDFEKYLQGESYLSFSKDNITQKRKTLPEYVLIKDAKIKTPYFD